MSSLLTALLLGSESSLKATTGIFTSNTSNKDEIRLSPPRPPAQVRFLFILQVMAENYLFINKTSQKVGLFLLDLYYMYEGFTKSNANGPVGSMLQGV